VGIDNLFSPKCPSGVYLIALLIIANGVWRFLYTPETLSAVYGALYIGIAVGLLCLDQWARIVVIALSVMDVGVFGVALTRLRHLRSLGSLIILLEFLLYAAMLGYLLMPRVRGVFTRNVPKVLPLAANE